MIFILCCLLDAKGASARQQTLDERLDRIPVRLEIPPAHKGARAICDALDKCSVARHVSLSAGVVPTALVNRVKPDDRHQGGLDACARRRILKGRVFAYRDHRQWVSGGSPTIPGRSGDVNVLAPTVDVRAFHVLVFEGPIQIPVPVDEQLQRISNPSSELIGINLRKDVAASPGIEEFFPFRFGWILILPRPLAFLLRRLSPGGRPLRRDDGGGEVNSARKPTFVEAKRLKNPRPDWTDLAEGGRKSAPIREEAQIAIQFCDWDPAFDILYTFAGNGRSCAPNPVGGN